MAISKYLCWSIWLCHNQAIFQNKRHNPETTAIKGMMLLFKVISSKGFNVLDMKDLSNSKKECLKISSSNLKSPLSKTYVVPSFCIRLEGEEFVEWQRKVEKIHLYFDGDSKGNPREAGAGGVIVNLKKKKKNKVCMGTRHCDEQSS